jgi:hypothetical protein
MAVTATYLTIFLQSSLQSIRVIRAGYAQFGVKAARPGWIGVLSTAMRQLSWDRRRI